MPMAEGLVLYFERTYVGRVLPGGTFQQPIFPIEMWNCHFEVLAGFPRTINSVEACHRSFNYLKIYSGAEIRTENCRIKADKISSGRERPTKRKNCQYPEETIRNLVRDYFNRSMMYFYVV